MVGPNTMLAATPWIKKNMLNIDPEQEKHLASDAEMRVKRCAEKLDVPDWYRNYFKPDTKFLKDKTPIEYRTPNWKTMNGKNAKKNAAKKSRTPKKEQQSNGKKEINAKPIASQQPVKSMPSPRKSLNSNYRISRKVDNTKNNNDRLSISITPTSSDNESEQPVLKVDDSQDGTLLDLSKSLRSPLNSSHTFPRMHPSRKIQNINIVFPADFTPKPPRRQLSINDNNEEEDDEAAASNESILCSTPCSTVYTYTKNIDVTQQLESLEDCSSSTLNSTMTGELSENSSNYTSFLLADVQPLGVTTRVQMFAGLDSDESEEHQQQGFLQRPASPHARFFISEKKSSELERIVQNSREVKRGNNLISEIIEELDRSIAESMFNSRRSDASIMEDIDYSQNFVKGVVRALETGSDNSNDESEISYEEDSELAKSTSISFKSDDGTSSANDDEQEATPLPTFEFFEEAEKEEEEEEVYWIPAQARDLARTSSRLSMLSRTSARSGFQCTSGKCSPGLSPIKLDRASRDKWTSTTLSSCRSSKKSSRQLFRIDETGVADSGCYSDRSETTTSQSSGTAGFSDDAESSSAMSSLSSSPTLVDFDAIASDILSKMPRTYLSHKSVRV